MSEAQQAARRNMPDYTLPFPGFDLAGKELSYDYCYGKIPPEDRSRIVKMAWDRGTAAAADIFKKYDGEGDFFIIAGRSGLSCEEVDKDYVMGNFRYFSDYLSGRKRIRLYIRSIALWAEQNKLDELTARNLILSHEYYHFLECTVLGLTSRLYQVPMLIAGPLKIGRTGIRALSEIGAHAFAHTYHNLRREGA
ncbi:MAG: hypothetical protein LBG27_10220 [Spirochaetaceae bacterium]|jgi:peptidoglycan/xylan/chitin deacetylase (PgdA/CDA1 family)|nr:hypothetical protein [Spirochaetaceae bacterium]